MESLKIIERFLFSKNFDQIFKLIIAATIAISLFTLIGVNFFAFQYIALIDMAVIAVLILVKFLDWGFYLLVLLFPFINFSFSFGSVNLPYVDLLAMLVFVAFFIRLLLRLANGEIRMKNFTWQFLPGVLFAAMFFVASALAITNNEFWQPALKYLFRPLIFFYLMFVVLPFNLINTKKMFERVLQVMVVVGIIVAIFGFMSVAFGPGPWYTHRAVPFTLGEFNPLGGNQNAIAETLVVTIPAAILLFFRSERIRRRGWYLLAILFMLMVLFLTFSRAGWLAVLVEFLILYFVKNRHRFDRYTVFGIVGALILTTLIFYFSVWNQLDIIKSSNENRIMLSGIAYNSFVAHPIIGNGLNTFQDLVGRTFVYKVEFGDPLDSHGFIQKISTESGALGLVTFIMLLGFIGFEYLSGFQEAKNEKDKQLLLALFVMLAGIIFFELFSTSYFIAKMWLPIGIGLAGVKLYRKNGIYE